MIDPNSICPGEIVDETTLREAYQLYKIIKKYPLVSALDINEWQARGLENIVLIPNEAYLKILGLLFPETTRVEVKESVLPGSVAFLDTLP